MPMERLHLEELIFNPDGTHAENLPRLAALFIKHIRAVVRGDRLDHDRDYVVKASALPAPPSTGSRFPVAPTATGFPASAYTEGTFRWNVFDAGGSVTFKVSGRQPGYDDLGAVQRGLAAWTNDPNSNVVYLYGGQNSAAFVQDGVNTVVMNNSTDVPAGAIAYAKWYAGGSHVYKGETFFTTTEGDVVVKAGLSVSQTVFDEAVTHELGHTLGFRHSDSAVPTSTDAVMNSVVRGTHGANLAQWDIDAVTTVYAAPASTCSTPSVTVSPNAVVRSPGQSTTFTASATGTAPFTYQWYTGSSGNTASPINGATGKHADRRAVHDHQLLGAGSNACGTANSATVTVTVSQPSVRKPRGDYNGDGRTDLAVFRPSTGVWWVRNVFSVQWGQNGDQPVPADYNGDRITDVAVFRPSTGQWWLRNITVVQWGQSGDIGVPADYDGDGRADTAVFRPSNGTWFIRYANGTTAAPVSFGQAGDVAVPGDYNGDGIAEIAVFRPSTGEWIIRSLSGVTTIQWGGPAISRSWPTTTATASMTSRSSVPPPASGGSAESPSCSGARTAISPCPATTTGTEPQTSPSSARPTAPGTCATAASRSGDSRGTSGFRSRVREN